MIKEPRSKFLEAKEEGIIGLVGIPMEITLSFRLGTRFGPKSIRDVSEVLESFSPYFMSDLENLPFVDLGDLALGSSVEDALTFIENEVKKVLSPQKRLLCVGGEHLITLPLVKSHKSLWPHLTVLHIDAHMDLRNEYEGRSLSHATVMRRVWEEVKGKVYQVGIRSGAQEEWEFSRRFCHLYPLDLNGLPHLLEEIGDGPLYLTLDLDVIDPGYLPGTGTPEAGGVSPSELFRSLGLLKGRNLVGADVVELSPCHDPTEASSILAAKVVRELLLLLGSSLGLL